MKQEKHFLVVVFVVVAKQHIVSRVHITTQQIERTLDGLGPSAHIKMGNIRDFSKVMQGEKHTACRVWLKSGGQKQKRWKTLCGAVHTL